MHCLLLALLICISVVTLASPFDNELKPRATTCRQKSNVASTLHACKTRSKFCSSYVNSTASIITVTPPPIITTTTDLGSTVVLESTVPFSTTTSTFVVVTGTVYTPISGASTFTIYTTITSSVCPAPTLKKRNAQVTAVPSCGLKTYAPLYISQACGCLLQSTVTASPVTNTVTVNPTTVATTFASTTTLTTSMSTDTTIGFNSTTTATACVLCTTQPAYCATSSVSLQGPGNSGNIPFYQDCNTVYAYADGTDPERSYIADSYQACESSCVSDYGCAYFSYNRTSDGSAINCLFFLDQTIDGYNSAIAYGPSDDFDSGYQQGLSAQDQPSLDPDASPTTGIYCPMPTS